MDRERRVGSWMDDRIGRKLDGWITNDLSIPTLKCVLPGTMRNKRLETRHQCLLTSLLSPRYPQLSGSQAPVRLDHKCLWKTSDWLEEAWQRWRESKPHLHEAPPSMGRRSRVPSWALLSNELTDCSRLPVSFSIKG